MRPNYCKKCVMSDQRPRIVFDAEGVCSACRYWEKKDVVIDWEKREKELVELLNRHRRSDGRFDVVVPSSGGKDSAYVAHVLKFRYNMNPLTVTWSPHLYTTIGWENFQGLISSGLSNVLGTPDRVTHAKLTRVCTDQFGDPFQPFIYGQVNFPLRIALAYDIPLIMDGENGEVEYGGEEQTENLRGFSIDDAESFWFSGLPVEFWKDFGFESKDLYYYQSPKLSEMREKNIERHFFSYYKYWKPQDHFYYAMENTNFLPNPAGRSEGTYSKYASLDDKIDPFHFYYMLLKFGIGRATSDAAHEIREGLITRDEGVELVRKFDAEFPAKSREVFMKYCGYEESDFLASIDKWRNTDLWEKDSAGNWVLKYQVE